MPGAIDSAFEVPAFNSTYRAVTGSCRVIRARLVQVGKAGGKDFAVQQQAPLAGDDDPRWARTLVLEVAEGMAGSAFQAVENRYCGMCPVRTSCPVQDDGRAVTG